jgi:uncharacterized membrane protein YiaA
MLGLSASANIQHPHAGRSSQRIKGVIVVNTRTNLGPSPAFIGASWFALAVGMGAYLIGLWNAPMQLNEKGYYFTVLMYGLFSAISVQKSVRDRLEGVPVTNIYYGLSWFSTILAICLLVIGLWNAEIDYTARGFYAIAFMMSLFAAIAVQKNTRDASQAQPTGFE